MIIATLLVLATVVSALPLHDSRRGRDARAEFAAQDRKGKDKPPVGKPGGTPGKTLGAGQTGKRGTSPAGVVTSITDTALRIRVGNEEQGFTLSEQTAVVGSPVASPKGKPLPVSKLVAVGDRVVVDYITATVIKIAETIRILPRQPPATGKPAATPAR